MHLPYVTLVLSLCCYMLFVTALAEMEARVKLLEILLAEFKPESNIQGATRGTV